MRMPRTFAVLVGVGFLSLLMDVTMAMAVSGYLTGTNVTNPGFNTYYNGSAANRPLSRSGANSSCNVCHVAGSGSDLNAYGNDWALQHNTGLTTAQAFAAVEGLNSDNDPKGVTNIREIVASAQPGWIPGASNTFYDVTNPGNVTFSNQNPPTITGNLDPAAKVAVYRSSSNTFYLDINGNGAYNGCTTDGCATFGTAGDIPLLGDWSGSGTARVGVFRPSTGTFYLDYNGNGNYEGCATDRCLAFGESTDTPLVGDWDGTGTTKVGVFRPSSGTFYLDYNGNGLYDGCAVDKCFAIATPTDTPLVGDWNGTGTTKVGFFRGSVATFFLDYDGDGALDGCVVDKCLPFGTATDIPLVGDWNGSGPTKIGVYRSGDLAFYLDDNGNGVWDGCATDRCATFGAADDVPLVGDWSGDGKTKIGAFRASAGAFYLDYNGSGGWDGCVTDRCVSFGTAGDTPLIAPK